MRTSSRDRVLGRRDLVKGALAGVVLAGWPSRTGAQKKAVKLAFIGP
jgi:hypothetical protein